MELRRKALASVEAKGGKKRQREPTGEGSSVEDLVAKARAEAKAKKTMLEHEAIKGRRILLYLPTSASMMMISVVSRRRISLT